MLGERISLPITVNCSSVRLKLQYILVSCISSDLSSSEIHYTVSDGSSDYRECSDAKNIQELERQLELLNEELKMEKQNLHSVEKVSSTHIFMCRRYSIVMPYSHSLMHATTGKGRAIPNIVIKIRERCGVTKK